MTRILRPWGMFDLKSFIDKLTPAVSYFVLNELVTCGDPVVALMFGLQIHKAISVASISIPIAMQIGDDHRHTGVERL